MDDIIEKLRNQRRFRIALITIVFSCMYGLLVTFVKVPDKDIVFLVTGYIFGIATSVISYYFGSSDKQDKEQEGSNV